MNPSQAESSAASAIVRHEQSRQKLDVYIRRLQQVPEHGVFRIKYITALVSQGLSQHGTAASEDSQSDASNTLNIHLTPFNLAINRYEKVMKAVDAYLSALKQDREASTFTLQMITSIMNVGLQKCKSEFNLSESENENTEAYVAQLYMNRIIHTCGPIRTEIDEQEIRQAQLYIMQHNQKLKNQHGKTAHTELHQAPRPSSTKPSSVMVLDCTDDDEISIPQQADAETMRKRPTKEARKGFKKYKFRKDLASLSLEPSKSKQDPDEQ